jgi:hypothetical protein
MAWALEGLRKGSGRGSGRRPIKAERPPSRTAFPLGFSNFLFGGAYIVLPAVYPVWAAEAASERSAPFWPLLF